MVEIIAHRGESAEAPENTLAAFRLAWERQADAIELDVHLTQDGRLIVCHDADTKRTTGVSHSIQASAFVELQALDAGAWKGARWAGERLPSLEEALETVPDGGRCFIELKGNPDAVPALANAVRASGKRAEQLAVISFQASAVAESRQRLPDLPAYLLSGFRFDEAAETWSPGIEELIEQALSIGANGLDLHFSGPLDLPSVERVKAAGLALYVWTVDDPEIARKMAARSVDGITTNRAAWLKAQLKG